MFPEPLIIGNSGLLTAIKPLARAAQAAYLPCDEIRDAAYKAGANEFHFLECERTSTQGFITVRSNVVVIAFRGSQELRDFFTDAKFRRRSWNGDSVHRGFAEAINSIWPQVVDAIASIRLHDKKVYFTGHSLGAALAMLGAWWMWQTRQCVDGVFTFGQPRVGDAAFARAYDNVLKSKTYRVVNAQDIVPRLPGVLAGYRHAGTELFLNSNGQIETDPSLGSKLFSDFKGLAAELDPVLPFSSVASVPLKNHFMAAYIKRLATNN